jgi:mRNA interferase MazF
MVLSIKPLDTDRALVSLIPHTTSPRGTRFELDLTLTYLKSGVFDAQNPVTAPLAKLIRRLGSLAADELTKVEDAVRLWLGL